MQGSSAGSPTGVYWDCSGLHRCFPKHIPPPLTPRIPHHGCQTWNRHAQPQRMVPRGSRGTSLGPSADFAVAAALQFWALRAGRTWGFPSPVVHMSRSST
eukprot:11795035-Alexandrium_andersonii.AAC.1